ncbi:AI-2E family transporter [bacterium]|nr:AI-2E family transporter [bacterium]
MVFKDIFTTKNLVFLLLLLIVLILLPQISELIMLFFACFVLACSMLPIVNWIDKKTNNRTLSVIIVVVMAVILTLAFILPVFTITIEQISLFFQSVPEKLAEIQTYLHNFNFAGHSLSEFVNAENIMDNGQEIAKSILSQSWNITMGFVQGIIVFVAIVTILFYMLKDSKYMKDKFIEFFPDNMKERANEITEKISQKVGGYVIATIISCFAIWIMIAISLLILKVEFAFSLGLIAGVLDIIPVLGPTIALTLIILSAYKRGVIVIALALVLFLGVQQISNNVIRPVVFGRFMDLHPLVIIFSLLVGGKFGGLIGLILAPAIAAIITVLIDELYLKTINKSK